MAQSRSAVSLTLWVPCLDRHCRLSLNFLSHPKRALHGLGAKSAGRAAGACSPSAVREFVVNRPGATIPQRGVTRSGFLAGFQGLAPYGIHVDSVLGVSETGVVSARLDASYDIMLSQKLIAQPYVEAMVASKDDPAIQLGSGLSRYELGFRLRYEIVKEFAPYVGLSFEQ